jgi:regulatory protein
MPNQPESQPSPAPDLYQAALDYLARYAATEAGLRRILLRRIDRWARAQPDPEAAEPALQAVQATIDGVIARLVEAGAVSDTAFAENRARSLLRGGQSSRSIKLRLVAKGVAPDIARDATASDAETELAAALVLVRKRRIGPYRSAEAADTAVRMKELALLARAGYSRDIADQALKMSREEAESRIFELRR